jgi:hypothetical protein
VRGAAPAVRSVALEADGAAPTAVDLGDALPLAALLAPVGAAKERIAAALDLLEPAPPGARTSGATFAKGVPGAQPLRALVRRRMHTGRQRWWFRICRLP